MPNGYPDNIDKLIEPVVKVLCEHGFKTFESCQGGEGHCSSEAFVRFEGDEIDLIRAVDICGLYGFWVTDARRIFRKVPVYADGNSRNARLLGKTWDRPFNELVFSIEASLMPKDTG